MATISRVYKLAIDNGVLSKNVSEDGFQNILKDDNLRKEYWEYAQKNHSGFYSSDYKTFSANAADMLKQSDKNIVERAVDWLDNDFKKSEEERKTLIQKWDEKNTAKERRVAAYNTIGLSEEEIASNKRKEQLEKSIYSPIGDNGVIDFKPKRYNLGVDGITSYDNLVEKEPTTPIEDIGVNQERKAELEDIKANQPSYLSRGEETIDDITANAMERSMNTKEGQQAYNEITNRYLEEFLQSEEFKKAKTSVLQGKMKEQDVQKIFNDRYEEKINNEYWEKISEENGLMSPYIDEALDRLQKRSAKRMTEDIEKRLEKEDIDSKERVRKVFKDKYGAYPEDFKPRTFVERLDAHDYLNDLRVREKTEIKSLCGLVLMVAAI